MLVGCRRRRGKLRVEVWDTGLGIPASKQKVVFREFQRLDQGARAARGLGLGLSIVERIARVLDHPITLQSRSRQGLDVLGRSSRPPRRCRPWRPSARRAPDGRGRRWPAWSILCIDNEPTILDGMRTLLGGLGLHRPHGRQLHGGPRGAERRKIVPDVIIADYHLDEGDGPRGHHGAALEDRHEMPAILLTADRSPAVRDAAAEKSRPRAQQAAEARSIARPLSQWRSSRVAAE